MCRNELLLLLLLKRCLRSHNDVVDGDVNELDEEADEAHDRESDGGGHGDLLEFCKRKGGKRKCLEKKNNSCGDIKGSSRQAKKDQVALIVHYFIRISSIMFL